MNSNKPVVIPKRAGGNMIVLNEQIYLPGKQWIGSLRIKLTTRSSQGERVVFISGRRAKTIEANILKKISSGDTYVSVTAVLSDRNGRVLREKTLNVKTGKETISSFLDSPMIKEFVKYNVAANRE